LTQHFKVKSLKGFGIEELRLGTIAAGAAFSYLDETHHFDIQHITQIQRLDENSFVWMDPFTIRNLELIYSPHPEAVTLLHILDKTRSAMGARLLNRWIVMALKDADKIKARHEIVDFFLKNDEKRIFLREKIENLSDLERMVGKISTGKITPKQLLSVAQSLEIITEIKAKLAKDKSIQFLINELTNWTEVYSNLIQTLSDEPPHQLVKGNVIAEGISEDLDHLRGLQTKGKDYLEELRIRETERTGIPSIKVSFNNVFGYYIEVRNTHKDKVPNDWIRKQTLVNAERYITEELKTYEEKILNAEDKIVEIEQRLYLEMVRFAADYVAPIQQNARVIAIIDCLCSFAGLALKHNYVKPKLTEENIIDIKEGRHAVIEQQLPPGQSYIPNDIYLDDISQQIMIITGPNMAGKSALL